MLSPVMAPPAVPVAPWAASLKPPGYWSGPAWPPPLAESAAALPGTGHHSIGKYAPRWLVYASSLAATGTEEALVEAYDIFREIVYHARIMKPNKTTGEPELKYGPGLVAAAAHNAAITLSQFHARPLIVAAAREATRSVDGMLDKSMDELVAMAHALAAEGAALRAPVRLRWGPLATLRADDPAAAAPRIAAMPAAGVEGRWHGIRHAMRAYGLAAPKKPPRTHGPLKPCRAYPRGDYVEVR